MPGATADAASAGVFLPNQRSHATLRASFAIGASPRVVHHPGSGLADLAADPRFRHRACADLRAPVVAAFRRRRATRSGRSRARRIPADRRDPRASCEDGRAGSARPHPRGRPREREGAASGHEGGDRGSRSRGHARPRALPHHARHDRRDVAAARALRHGRRHDRDLRVAELVGVESHPARAGDLDRALQHGDGPHRRHPVDDLLPVLPGARSTASSSKWSSRPSSSSISRTGNGSRGGGAR